MRDARRIKNKITADLLTTEHFVVEWGNSKQRRLQPQSKLVFSGD